MQVCPTRHPPTVTTVLQAPPGEAFSYLADIENLPDWATEFARDLKREGADYKVVNDLGEFFIEVQADPQHGVIDMFASPSGEVKITDI